MLAALACCAVVELFAASAPAIESFSYRSLSVVFTPQGELTALAQATFVAPDKYREDASMSFGNIVTIRNGEASWGANPHGVVELTPDQHRRTVDRLYRNYVGLLWAVSDGRVEAEDGGDGDVILNVEGLAIRAKFDESNGRLLEIAMPGANLAGAPVTERRVFTAFDEETGLPMKVDVLHDDELSAQITIKTWELNVSAPDEFFARPGEGTGEPQP